ncbi:MAG TPA: SRPBCC domain-containing protein [Gaiellaceae bacterium]|jgi:uncharacterized protein YndB with AHSA1/START domain|nr:SRPBCC domain-containing protein [Gaiellaceae bacterium]
MTEATGAGGREVTVSRVFDAPRELVWKAWTDPGQFAAWFGGPPYTTPPSTVSMDVRPGGEWRATMVSDEDGSELPFQGVYREVEEPERLVLTFDDPSEPNNPNVEVLTITFTDLGDGRTEVVAHQAGHLPEEEYEKLKEGYSTFFDQLAEHLARAK